MQNNQKKKTKKISRNPIKKKELYVPLERYSENPIISPRPNNPWDCVATFNPGVVKIGRKIYILYRAVTRNNISVLGLAITEDGYTIDERLDQPIYVPRESFEINPGYHNGIDPNKPLNHLILDFKYISGPGYFGVEDPRLTRIGNRIYMTYVAFNGFEPPRVAITSIKVKDFVEGNWDWEWPKLITHPAIPDKSCVLFPRKIRGKYMFFHRIFPNIWADYVDDLKFENRFLWGRPIIKTRPKYWDSRKVGAGSVPIETSFGWILVYYAVSGWDPYYLAFGLKPEDFAENDPYYRYKIGIMVLDKENPEKVIFRPDKPSLIPEKWYEGTIAYPGGAVIKGGKLFVYYGAADYHVAVASVDVMLIKEVVEEVINETGEVHVQSNSNPRLKGGLGRGRNIQSGSGEEREEDYNVI